MTWKSILPFGIALIVCPVLPGQTTTVVTGTNIPGYQLKMNLSGMAAGMLNQTGKAQDAIANHDRAMALQHLDRALGLANRIESSAPAHSGSLVVPIYTEYNQVTWLGPVKGNARRGPAVIEGGVRANRMKKGTHVESVEGNYTAVSVNVDQDREQLQAARSAVDNGNWQGARAALDAVQSSMIQKTVSGNMPLLRARRNLELARSEIMNNQWDAAKAPLEAAAQALQDAEAGMPGSQAAQVEATRKDILHYAKDPDDHKATLLGQVNNWWDTTSNWINNSLR